MALDGDELDALARDYLVPYGYSTLAGQLRLCRNCWGQTMTPNLPVFAALGT